MTRWRQFDDVLYLQGREGNRDLGSRLARSEARLVDHNPLYTSHLLLPRLRNKQNLTKKNVVKLQQLFNYKFCCNVAPTWPGAVACLMTCCCCCC